MNEQLVVKNFGPIKDATVDFKRVTVFIGPTGGGKSTLAKLAAVFRDGALNTFDVKKRKGKFDEFSLEKFFQNESSFEWQFEGTSFKMNADLVLPTDSKKSSKPELKIPEGLRKAAQEVLDSLSPEDLESILNSLKLLSGASNTSGLFDRGSNPRSLLKYQVDIRLPTTYFPSNRSFISAIEYSWAGLLRDDIGLPKDTLDFANDFSLSRKNVPELEIPFLNVKYLHRNGQDFIKIPESETLFRLYETASGIQSVTPLLVLLEHLSRNTEQAQSFIIEEPELNLYPTAQQGLLNWLVEKCTQGENDLTITTHSPYILSSCNLLLEAYKVAQQRPELADEIDKIVPRACWLNPEEFAAYYVADGTVKPITDERTHLIGGNELDAVSGDISDSFRRLLQLKKQVA